MLNDTIMAKLSKRKVKILEILAVEGENSSSDIQNLLKERGEDVSLVTVKRDMSDLLEGGYLEKHGRGRSTSYSLSLYGRFYTPIDSHEYCSIPPDDRLEEVGYDFGLFGKVDFDMFTEEEYEKLEAATKKYRSRSESVSDTIHEKELQRFMIELSWKSSRIEGNTYSLLDTEKLIKEGVQAEGHSEDEAKMILNHKKALEFILDQRDKFSDNIDISLIDEIHKRVVDELSVDVGLRESPVGITGTVYRPIDNKHQIKEALEDFCSTLNRITNPYDKTLLTLLGISYIQPFEDGNKRTARLLANAILFAHKLAPLSYRSVDEDAYKEATLVFYELQSIVPMKEIFIDQYIFSADNYSVE